MTKHKLTKREREYIKRWLSEYFSYTEIVKLVKEEFKKDITPQAVEYYNKRYLDEIYSAKQEFLKNLKDIPETNRLIRIHRLALLSRRLFLKNSREYRETLKQIREEMNEFYQIEQKDGKEKPVEEDTVKEKVKDIATLKEEIALIKTSLGEELNEEEQKLLQNLSDSEMKQIIEKLSGEAKK